MIFVSLWVFPSISYTFFHPKPTSKVQTPAKMTAWALPQASWALPSSLPIPQSLSVSYLPNIISSSFPTLLSRTLGTCRPNILLKCCRCVQHAWVLKPGGVPQTREEGSSSPLRGATISAGRCDWWSGQGAGPPAPFPEGWDEGENLKKEDGEWVPPGSRGQREERSDIWVMWQGPAAALSGPCCHCPVNC